MGFLKQSFFTIALVAASYGIPQPCHAQEVDEFQYERASICMMLVKYPATNFGNEIQYVFSRMQIPARFNSHELGVRLVSFASEREQIDNIRSFIRQVNFGKRCVAKWFNRDKETGWMNMDLIRERGLYNATSGDLDAARQQMRGLALIEDAGELLIQHTYLVVNDITYIDKSVGWGIFKDALNISKGMADIWTHTEMSDNDNPFLNPSLSSINATLDDIKGFRVKIKSYLFKLKWDEDVANQFYNLYYIDAENPDRQKKEAFKAEKGLFEMEYAGMVENTSSKTSLSGVTTNEQLITKVCTRALDKNLADLQHKVPDFRIKAPLLSVSPLQAAVGLKEDISESSRFEVLERRIDKEGHIHYKRVGIIKPVKGKIWDNQYMAQEEGGIYSQLQHTEFTKISGSDFYPGMLIREIE